MAWLRKVNRHVQVFINPSGAIVRVKPGTITALGAGELVTVRYGHSGATLANVPRRTDPDAQTYPCYIPL
jgi:hypothetical protein